MSNDQNLNRQPNSDVLIYQTNDQQTEIEVILGDETVWLPQAQMAELFRTTKQNVSLHIKNVFSEGELSKASVVKDSLTTASDGKSYKTGLYNLDVIISVGYRVKPQRGTQFRMWATQRLKEFLVKGFILDDDRLAEGRTEPRYFDELITLIRAIRASERNFYRKFLQILPQISKPSIASILRQLKSDAAIKFIGKPKSGYWCLNDAGSKV